MDPDPRKRAGGGEGERRREVLRLLFLGEGDEGALASSSLADDVGPGSMSVCTNN